MVIRILHIDDEKDVLEKVKQVVNGTELEGCTLQIIDSCSFEEGMDQLINNHYDLVILDLCVGPAGQANEKLGESIFNQIKERAFIPVLFFTGLADYVRPLQSDIVKVASKQDGYDALFAETAALIKTGFINIKRAVDDIIREGVRSYFWNFVHPNSKTINQIKNDEVSLKYLLLRRLSKALSSETLKATVEDPNLKKELTHPMEFYIFPPVDGEFETGDIVKVKNSDEYFIILTPACDLILRNNGRRKADRILLIQAVLFKAIPDFEKYQQLKQQHQELIVKQQQLPEHRQGEMQGAIKEAASQVTNAIKKLKELMKPGNDRFFFLPQTPFLPALLADFQYKKMVTYDELEGQFEVAATLDDPFVQSVQSSFLRYYNRVGFPDLDVDYAFGKLE